MEIKVSKFIKKKINKSELKEIFKISNIIEEYLNQKEVNQSVCKKVENFFYEENYLNIDSAIVFGY